MQSADSSQIGPRPRFPALDPEPLPHPRRRLGAALIVGLGIGLGSWLGYNLSGTVPHHRAAVTASFIKGLAGVVLAETPGSYLSATDMQTGKVVVFSNLGQFSSNPEPAVTADGRYLLDAAIDRLLSLSSIGQPQIVPNALSFPTGEIGTFMADPWSDHDNGVVEVAPNAMVEFVRTGRAVSLGAADFAAGDPQHAGAFIGVPGPGQPSPDAVFPDGEVVLADVGARPRLLATTPELNHAAGIKRTTRVSLVPIPSPQGSMVAVEAIPLARNSVASVAVLSRHGVLLGSRPLGGGGLAWVGWSHSGRALAFVGYSRAGPELTEWTVSGRSVTTVLHNSTKLGPTACAWSPDDTSVICDGGPHGNWLIIRSGTESVTTGQGQPLAWTIGRLRG